MASKIVAAFLSCTCTAALFACVPAASGGVGSLAGPVGGSAGDSAGKVSGYGDAERSAIPVESTSDILGEWDIVRFEGYEPGPRMSGTARTAFADFRESGVALRIGCNYSGAAGVVRDGVFRHRPSDNLQTAMGCGAEREARDVKLFGFFRADPRVDRLPDGSLRLVAGGTELLLERPARRRLAFLPKPQDLLGEWRLVEISRHSEGGGMSGIGLSDVPGRIVIDGMSLGYSRCAAYTVAYRYTSEGFLEKTGGPALPTTEGGCKPLEGGWKGGSLPVPWDVLRVLHGNPAVEKIGDDTLLLAADRYSLVITRAPCRSLDQANDHGAPREVDCASAR